jgi:hypothetical protein
MKDQLIESVLEKLKNQFSEEQILSLMENNKEFSKIVNKALLDERLTKIREGYKRNSDKSLSSKMLVTQRLMKEHKNPRYVFEAADVPNYSTGINYLEDLLKKIVPSLMNDYRKLTTSYQQRKSFRDHVLNGVINALQSARLYDKEEGEQVDADGVVRRDKKLEDENSNFEHIENDFASDVKTGNEIGNGKFINITKSDSAINKKDEDYNLFLINGKDRTGANAAFDSFNKIKKQIKKTYEMLDDKEDQKNFYEYLILNLRLYFEQEEEKLRYDLPPEKLKEIENSEPDDAQEVNSEEANPELEGTSPEAEVEHLIPSSPPSSPPL